MDPRVAERLTASFREDPNLPTLPESASRVLALLENEEVQFGVLAREVEKDPALTLAVLRLANSPAYAVPREITTLPRAFSVIGLRQIPSLLAGFASVGSCESFLQDPRFRWDEFWRHCGGTAFIAATLARRLGLRLDGAVFLAGLLHDVGFLALAKFDAVRFGECVREATEGRRSLQDVLRLRFGIDEPGAGYLLAQTARLGPDILGTIRHKRDPAGAPEGVRPLVAVVSLASELAHVIGLTFCRGAADVEVVLQEHPAWRVLHESHPEMARWDVARLVFELEREYQTSEVFVQEARPPGGTG